MLCDSLHDLLTSGPSNREKYLQKFFKICHMGFWWLVCDSFQSWKRRVLHNEGYFQGSFQKLFIFSLHIVTVHSLVRPSLFQTHHFHSQNLHFFHHLLTNLQEKVWVLSFSQCNFLFLSYCGFLLRFEHMMFEYGLLMFCWVWSMGFVGIMLYIHVFFFFKIFFSCLLLTFEYYTLFVLCCVVHIMPIIKCLIDIFLCFWELHGLQCA